MKQPDVVVIGAGIVGICTALGLRRQGYSVLLIDRSEPGGEASSGNAGVICSSGIHPLADPGLLKQTVTLMSNSDSRLLLRYQHIPALFPWLTRFALNCRQSVFRNGTTAIASIANNALEKHITLMQQAEASSLLRETGWLRLYRTVESFAAAKRLVPSLESHSVPFEILDSEEIQQLEPDLGVVYAGALWMTATHSLGDPAALSRKYFNLCLTEGVDFENQSVKSINQADSLWTVGMNDRSVRAPKIVITLGPWCNELLRPLGIKLPFAMERGYHMMFRHPKSIKLGRSIVDVDKGYVMTPMDNGIRVTTASNLVAKEAPADPQQLFTLLPEISKTFAVGDALLDQPWMGRRATTPDSLPLIGPINNHPNLFVATGHCHLGLTLAPITAELIVKEIEGRPDPLCKPFYPCRF